MIKTVKIITFALVINLFACLMARFEYDRHPDFNFPPTDPANVVIYDRFLPTKKFIIIGRIVMEQAPLTDMKKSVQRMQEISASMGGDAILISGSQIAWIQYNKAVTSGTANIYDYGYTMYISGTTTTTYYQTNVPIRKYYYGYVARWLDSSARVRPPSPFSEKRDKGKTLMVNIISKRGQKEIEVDVKSKIIMLEPIKGYDSSAFHAGMSVEMIYFSDKDIRLYYLQDGIRKEVRYKKVEY